MRPSRFTGQFRAERDFKSRKDRPKMRVEAIAFVRRERSPRGRLNVLHLDGAKLRERAEPAPVGD